MLQNISPCTRYVSTSGDDAKAGTSLATAWRNLDVAVPRLVKGDTLCVAAGTYDEDTIAAKASGTETDPITVRALGSTRPLIVSSSDTTVFDIHADQGRRLGYWLIDGVEIDEQQHAGASVRIEADRATATDAARVDHVVVRNSVIGDSKAGSWKPHP